MSHIAYDIACDIGYHQEVVSMTNMVQYQWAGGVSDPLMVICLYLKNPFMSVHNKRSSTEKKAPDCQVLRGTAWYKLFVIWNLTSLKSIIQIELPSGCSITFRMA